MRVIALCGGIGERLRPHTYDTHKCLLDINGYSLIEHFLDALLYSEAVIEIVHIVVGHYGYKFRKLLGSNYEGLKIQFHENPLHKITGAAQSLYLMLNVLKKNPCLVLEGDHYLDPDLMLKLLNSAYENCILVDEDLSRIHYDEEVLAYGYKGLVDRLKWLPPYPENPLGEALTIFNLSKNASNALATILEASLLQEGSAKREIIQPFNLLMRSHDIHYETVNGAQWVEVDFLADLERARSMKFE